MEDNWDINLDLVLYKPIKATKRVLSSQGAKKINQSYTTKPIRRPTTEPELRKKNLILSQKNTEHSKHSGFKQKLEEKTPSQRRKTELCSGQSTNTPAPVSRISKSNPKKAFKPLQHKPLFTQKPAIEIPKQVPGKPAKKLVQRTCFSSSPPKTRTSQPSSVSHIKNFEICTKQRTSYDPNTQRQRIFDNSLEFNGNKKCLETERKETERKETERKETEKKENELNKNVFVNKLLSPNVINTNLRVFSITPTPGKAELFEILLQDIPQEYSEIIVRELLRGFHLVAVTLDNDNITGECRGNGKILMRTMFKEEIEGLIAKLKKFGVTAVVNAGYKGRRNNFSEFFSENWRLRKEPVQTSPGRAREAKLRSLQSSIFS